MSQLPLRLVPPPREAPPGIMAGGAPSVRAGLGGGSDTSGFPLPVAGDRRQAETTGRAATIERLRTLVGSRGRIGILPPPPDPSVGPSVLDHGSVSTGIADLDDWLHGWPRPGPVEITGKAGAGRLGLVIPMLARLTREGRTVLFVDPLHQVHPPGLGGVDLGRLVLVRPPAERAAWAAEQVARSGAVDVLVLVDGPPLGRGAVRLARAAEGGNVGVFVLAERPESELLATLRLEVGGWAGERIHVRCTRARDGRRVGERLVAPWEPPREAERAAARHEGVETLRFRRGTA